MRTLTLALLLIGCGDKEDDTADIGGTTDDTAETSGEEPDSDGDGFTADVDCDDSDSTVNPDAVEVCDGADNDCDGAVDADDDSLSDGLTVYADDDGDGYGAGEAATACDADDGWSEVEGDCDDSNADISPDAEEVCDSDDVDEDCDGFADDADDSTTLSSSSTFYTDADGDGYGNPDLPVTRCDATSGYVADNTDCYDDSAVANPADGCWNGDWSGILDSSVYAEGLGADVCTGAVNVLVDMTSSPMINGTGACTTSLLGTLSIIITGDIASDDTVSGTLDIGGVVTDTWSGNISESGLEGTASGKDVYSGISFSYEVALGLERD